MKLDNTKIYSLFKNAASKGFFHFLSANILLRVFGFGSQLFLVKFLTPEQLGQIKAMQSINEIAFFVAIFGLNGAVLKTCAEDRAMADKAAIFWQYARYACITTAFVLLSLYGMAQLGWLSPDKDINTLIPYFMWAIPASVLMRLLLSYLQAIKQVKKIATTQIVSRLIGVFLIVFLTWQFGIYGFVLGTVAIGYISYPVVIFYVRDFLKKDNSSPTAIIPFSETKHLAGWSFLSNFSHRLAFNMDIILLNYLIMDREGFGYYSIATIFIIPIREITTSVRSISLPYLSEKLSDKKEFDRVMNKYRRLMLMQSFLITLAACIAVPLLVAWLYGEQYSDVGIYFVILATGYIFHSYQALIPTALISMGKMKYTFYAALSYLPLSILFHYLMIDYYGLTGAAIAKTLTAFLMTLIIIWWGNKGIREYYEAQASV